MYFEPKLTCEEEAQTLTRKETNRIQASEIKFVTAQPRKLEEKNLAMVK
jgi:hypothetical protein